MDKFFRKDWLDAPFAGTDWGFVYGSGYIHNEEDAYYSFTDNGYCLAAFDTGFTKDFLLTDPNNRQRTRSNIAWTCLPAVFNVVGYYMTIGLWYRQLGFMDTYQQSVAEQIGGYPKGSILKFFEGDEGFGFPYGDHRLMREVVSLQDNNTKNFVYDEETNPEPYKIGEADENGVVWWKFVGIHEPKHSCSLLPDMSQNQTTKDSFVPYGAVMGTAVSDGKLTEVIQAKGENYTMKGVPGIMSPLICGARWKADVQIRCYPPKLVEIEQGEEAVVL